MKRPMIITVAVVSTLFITALIINPLTIQSASKGSITGKPIPANVMKIADKSCVKCHTEPGDFMAVSHLNLSNWDKYSPEKQAAKASSMCTMVTKDKMPPKGFRSKHPDGVPTTEEQKTICDWAASLQVTKK
ncbi:MAG: heme-binding domain-containing protein [Bacteroidales bacterium]